jgi:hypothetical protein
MANEFLSRLIGTLQNYFKIGGSSGIRLKNNSGVLQVRNAGDSADAGLKASALTLSAGASANASLEGDGSGVASWKKHNLSASVAPTVNDDSGDGYSVGSRWLIPVSLKEYVCLNPAVSAAVWLDLTAVGGVSYFQSGVKLRWLANDKLIVQGGSLSFNDAIYSYSEGKVLTMGTGADWLGGSSAEAASTWVNVYAPPNGADFKLHSALPNNSNYSGNTFVTGMRVNDVSWNGTAANGLNETVIPYDGDLGGEGNVVAGMLLGVYSDSAYTLGRGKGSGAASSLNNMNFALITAIDLFLNTITVEGGHQIAFNNNDYLIVVENAPMVYRYVSGVTYRWVGAMYNNASSNLEQGFLYYNPFDYSSSVIPTAILTDEKTANTAGGSASGTTWNARNVNAVVADTIGIVITSNQIALPAGKYRKFTQAPAYKTGNHRLRLYNVTAAASVKEGQNARSGSADDTVTNAVLECEFVANGTDVYRIDHYTTVAAATNGLGVQLNVGGAVETYMIIYLEKIG